MTATATAAAFLAGTVVAWLCLRGNHPTLPTTPRPTDLARRPTIVDPTTPWPDLPDRPDSDWLPDPDHTAEINSWLFCTNDGPAEILGQPRYTGEPDTVTPFQAGSETLLRAMSRLGDKHITTAEVRAVVEGAA